MTPRGEETSREVIEVRDRIVVIGILAILMLGLLGAFGAAMVKARRLHGTPARTLAPQLPPTKVQPQKSFVDDPPGGSVGKPASSGSSAIVQPKDVTEPEPTSSPAVYPVCPECKGVPVSKIKCPGCDNAGKCVSCKGTGKTPLPTDFELECALCGGSEVCEFCKGKGFLVFRCPKCRATGHVLGEIRIDMTTEQVKAAIGSPDSVNTTLVRGLRSEQWIYGDSFYVYVDNGKVSAIQH